MLASPTAEFLDFSWCEESDSHVSFEFTPKDSGEQRPFRSRRSHAKSRGGCANCKRRRIKCDEVKPECGQCGRHEISCYYLPRKETALARRHPKSIRWEEDFDHYWSIKRSESMELTLIATEYAGIIANPQGKSGSKSLLLALWHFSTTAYSTIGSSLHYGIIRKHSISFARDPLVLHALCAFSARHMYHLQPESQPLGLSADFHQEKAMELLLQDMSGQLPASRIDTWFMAFMMLHGLAFYGPLQGEPGSFLQAQNQVWARKWLGLSSFMTKVLASPNLKPHLANSVWTPIIVDADDENNSFFDSRPGAEDLDPNFVSLCGIGRNSDALNNPYHSALRSITPMLRITPSLENFCKFITFHVRCSDSFRQLYGELDPAALVIMAHWFACMSQIDHWWCKTRAQTECLAICNYLDGWPDERVQTLLDFPMQRCGYVSFDEDLIQACVFGM